MEKRRTALSLDEREENVSYGARDVHTEGMGLTQIQRLVRLLDRSDIGEIELNRADEGLHLVLRKFTTREFCAPMNGDQSGETGKQAADSNEVASRAEKHCLRASIVGIFHHRLKPQSKIVVAVGDLVKVGQVVGTIEALNILNEITAPVAGCVVEIPGKDGQMVEYGQPLMIIDGSGRDKV